MTRSSGSTTCHCPRYDYPHRKSGGQCIWNPAHDAMICAQCGRECRTLAKREKEMAEFWGIKQPTVREWVESECCAAEVVFSGKVVRYGDL